MNRLTPISILVLVTACGVPCDVTPLPFPLPDQGGWCEPPPEADPCEPLQECLDDAADPCGAYSTCTFNQPAGYACEPECDGGPCAEVCDEPEACIETYQCIWECEDLCDVTCLQGCWLPSPDCLGTICVTDLSCEACP